MAVQVSSFGTDLGRWDLLLLSGWATLAAGLVAASRVPPRLRLTVERLVDRGVLVIPDGDLPSLDAEIRARSLAWATRTGAIVAAAIAAAFLVAYREDLSGHTSLLVLEALGGFVGGYHLGRLASFGRLGVVLRRRGCSVQPLPGHVDGAAGLKPIGDLYFRLAMVVGIPAAYLALWWVLIPLKGEQYKEWRTPYLGLLVVAVTLELLAFVVPMLSFHAEMTERKREFLREADKLSIEITELTAAPAAKERLLASTERYQAIEEMPTWPVDRRTRRRFRVNNIALLMPLVGQALGDTELGKQVAEVLRAFAE